MELDDLEIQRNVHRVITERIEAICAERGIEKLNHRDIAAECGLSQSVVSLYIKGFMIEARYRQVMRFLSWLGIPPTEFAQKVGLYPSLLQV